MCALQIMTMAAFFVACKVEETPRPLDHIVREGWKFRVLHYGSKSDEARDNAMQRLHDPVRSRTACFALSKQMLTCVRMAGVQTCALFSFPANCRAGTYPSSSWYAIAGLIAMSLCCAGVSRRHCRIGFGR